MTSYCFQADLSLKALCVSRGLGVDTRSCVYLRHNSMLSHDSGRTIQNNR